MHPTIKGLQHPHKHSLQQLFQPELQCLWQHLSSHLVQLSCGMAAAGRWGKGPLLWKGSPGEARHISPILASPQHQQHTPEPLHVPHRGLLCQPPVWQLVVPGTCCARPTVGQKLKNRRAVYRQGSICWCCSQLQPGLAVVCAQRWVREFPANSPRSSSSCSSCLLPARLSSSTCPIPKAGCGIPDGMCLAGCTAAPVNCIKRLQDALWPRTCKDTQRECAQPPPSSSK